jgi:sulfite exporter TauE/SafE
MLTALLLGIAGSIHCVGMCGPLALALPLDARTKRRVLGQMAVYHAGRVLTYAALGVLFGLLGQGLVLAGVQKIVALAAGGFMIAMAFVAWRFEQLVVGLPGFGALTGRVKRGMGRVLREHPRGAPFSLGLLNGLLPCGMVYAALAGAIAAGGALQGAAFMALFGLGTLPLMLAATTVGRSFSQLLRRHFRVVQPVLLTLAGAVLLARGLHLDLSLFLSAVPPAGLDCH